MGTARWPLIPASLPAAALWLLSGCIAGCRAPSPVAEAAILPDPAMPAFAVQDPPEAPLSRIRIPVTVAFAGVRERLEMLVPARLQAKAYEEDFGTGGTGRPSCGVACGFLLSRGRYSFYFRPREITLESRFGYGFRCHKRIPCLGPHFRASCGFGKEAPRDAVLRLAGSWEVRPDWSTKVHLRLLELKSLDPCKVTFLKIDIADMLMSRAAEGFGKVAPLLDSVLDREIRLRVRAEKAWERLSRPIALGKDLHLQIRPRAAFSSPLVLSAEEARITVGITASPRLVLGEAPAPESRPLPDLERGEEDGGVAIILPIRLEYAAVNRILRDSLRLDSGGTRIGKEPARSVTLTDASIFAYGEKVAVRLAFKGSLIGSMVLVGRPVMDSAGAFLSVADLDYSAETRGILVGAAEWLLHEPVARLVQRHATVDLRKPIRSVMGRLQEALNADHGRVHLSAELGKPVFSSLIGDPAGLTAYLRLDGAVRVRVDG